MLREWTVRVFNRSTHRRGAASTREMASRNPATSAMAAHNC